MTEHDDRSHGGAAHGPGRGTALLDRYFALSDTAGRSQEDFEELIGLFAPGARLEPSGGPAVEGTAAIREFFRTFLERNAETHHVWRSQEDAGRVLVEWAVSVRRSGGEVLALSGTDTATLAPDGRIGRLRVTVAQR